MSHGVEIERLTVRYGGIPAVEDVSLQIGTGEFFSVLGPSGCGKTTVLRALSGFVRPDAGRIVIRGRDMTGVPPERRPTALVFQNLALFPNMTVEGNVGYGLRMAGIGGAERRRRVDALLDLVDLSGKGESSVAALSGGQRQRVAIARALAVEPEVLLLDEPLSALDLKLRQHLRQELRDLQRRVGITFVYITHDQGEALAMSDRIAVMNRGRIEQVGSGRTIYHDPATAFVAGFVGDANRLPGRVLHWTGASATVETPLGPVVARGEGLRQSGRAVTVFIRPEHLRPSPVGTETPPERRATIRDVVFEGQVARLALRLADGSTLNALDAEARFRPGEPVAVEIVPGQPIAFPAEGG